MEALFCDLIGLFDPIVSIVNAILGIFGIDPIDLAEILGCVEEA